MIIRLCGDGTIYHISERSQLAAKEYKTRYDWVGKIIHSELCKRSKFDYTTNSQIQTPESVREN